MLLQLLKYLIQSHRARFQIQYWVNCSYWTTVAVLVLPMHHMIWSSVFPPDQLVKQVIESWDETKLSQHLVDLCRDSTSQVSLGLIRDNIAAPGEATWFSVPDSSVDPWAEHTARKALPLYTWFHGQSSSTGADGVLGGWWLRNSHLTTLSARKTFLFEPKLT